MSLTNCQAKALKQFKAFLADASKGEFAVTGPSGSGKSYLIAEMVLSGGSKGVLTATTNQACYVLHDATKRPVQTIHTLLGLTLFDDYKTGSL